MLTTTDLDRHTAAIAVDGFTVLERVIEPAFIDALVATIDRLLHQLGIEYGENAFLGEHTRRIFNLLARDPIFADVPMHPAVLPLIERVLDHQCLLSSLTAIEMGPGQRAQPLHADDGSIALPRPHVPIVCVAIWALTDFTLENGATHVVPGSHLADRRPGKGERTGEPTFDAVFEVTRAVMPKGSVIVYNGSLWHGGGHNDSDERRVGIVVNHCAGYMRQEENQLLAVPREMAATFPRRLQEMLGYGVYRGLMGHVDKQDPGVFLDPDVETDMVWKRMR
jgi:ectoine hydroxylase-related dioxygenase (phytanoyl-CoA dioxygenase family)